MTRRLKIYPILFLKILFLSPIILVFIFINFFIKLKIGRIESRLIGHFIPSLEIFICENLDNKMNKVKVIWFVEKKISNQFILKKFKKKIVTLPRIVIEPIQIFFSLFKFGDRYIFYYLDKYGKKEKSYSKKVDEHYLLTKYPSSLSFTNKENAKGAQLLNDLKLDSDCKFICFAARSGDFKNEKITSTRNADINKQFKAIKFLTSKNYKAVRLGKNNVSKIKWSNDNIIDISFDKNKSDFLDLYLMYKCQFFLTSQSGINYIATLLRKKRLITNYYNFNLLHHEALDLTPIILPKKFISKKTNTAISYLDVFQKKILLNENLESLREKNFDLYENTDAEIENATINMYLYNEKKLDIKTLKDKQKNFWNNHFKYFNVDTRDMIICPTFFEQNMNLFE